MATSRINVAWLRPTMASTLPRPMGKLPSGCLRAKESGAGAEEELAVG
jgi:hypothetical protein